MPGWFDLNTKEKKKTGIAPHAQHLLGQCVNQCAEAKIIVVQGRTSSRINDDMVIIYPGMIAGGMTRMQVSFPAFRYLHRCVTKWISSLDHTEDSLHSKLCASANILIQDAANILS